jgi:hypothetical protein
MISPITHTAPAVIEEIHTYTFIREENRWFISLPEYFKKGWNKMEEMVEGAQSMLNTIARGRNTISLRMDREPFEGADSLELIEHAPRGGAYYMMNTCNGKKINKKVYLCDLNLFVFGDMPDGVYFRTY